MRIFLHKLESFFIHFSCWLVVSTTISFKIVKNNKQENMKNVSTKFINQK